ncbi:hypothetical protein DXX93_07920 [Thalassotalea euphylliae]|uniref:Uncharacterized protein n=1 Tax=Thalassotalea euphylliae TaxID=1655234 RepID=A0A3E0TPR5_9GAMM|nr:hypothetical protein [Thalassotalea euphylliae]REL26514.1 hypothetical protein DXX93_07920 [Thalassotalea euphylliae]
MTFMAILATILGVLLADDNGSLTANVLKRLAATFALTLALVLVACDYGTLRGVFVFLGIAGAIGALYTLVRARPDVRAN